MLRCFQLDDNLVFHKQINSIAHVDLDVFVDDRQFDVEVSRYYHCISRCVRRAFLCGDGYEHRKQWIEDRLELLAGNFAISVCGFSVMDNHLHVLVRLDPGVADQWTDEQVVRRWIAVYPPRTLDQDDEKLVQMWVDREASDEEKVAKYRARLEDLGWFMKSLKEPLARLANKEDDCKGTFWESRYKSIAVLDEEALLATCAYIDLNPVAAGLVAAPETNKHTSVRQRVHHAKSQDKLAELKAAARSSLAGSHAAGRLEESHWLCPVEDLRKKGSSREGMLENFSLGSYLLLFDYTSRLCRAGKARLSREVAGILDRLGTSAEYWEQRMKKLFGKPRLLGSYFATSAERLKEIAARRGVHHVDNEVSLARASQRACIRAKPSFKLFRILCDDAADLRRTYCHWYPRALSSASAHSASARSLLTSISRQSDHIAV